MEVRATIMVVDEKKLNEFIEKAVYPAPIRRQ